MVLIRPIIRCRASRPRPPIPRRWRKPKCGSPASVVTYAHHASVGRVHWSHVSSSILYEVKPPTPAAVLAAVADAKDVAATLAGYEPQAPNYIALKAKLADLRAGKTGPGKTPIARMGATPERSDATGRPRAAICANASTAVRPTGRSTRSLPISSVGAGCRTTWARIM